MKIVLATPLYPPDVAEPAPYIKELAKRLAEEGHSITIVAYTRLPEKITGVRIISISKHALLPLRLAAFMKNMISAGRAADVIYAENGPSVELPMIVATFLIRTLFILHIGDTLAYERAEKNIFLRYIKRAAIKRAHATVTDTPLKRPEILPFHSISATEKNTYEESWKAHIRSLMELFTHV